MVESKGVAVVDIPNAFVQTNNDKLKSHHRTDIVKVKGSLADMLVEIDSDTCGPHLIKEIGVSWHMWTLFDKRKWSGTAN